MRKFLYTTCLTAAAVFAAGRRKRKRRTGKASQDAKQWVMQAGNFANTRYSTLKQITADNVGKLQVAWTFSTGVLRGHEGGPLVIGDMMYVHTPFPNTVYALESEGREQDRLEVRAEAGSERHSGDVLRHGQSRRRLCGRQDLPASGRHDAGRARRQDRQGRVVGEERRSRQGRDRHLGAARVQGQGHHRHLGRRVRRPRFGDRLQHQGRQAGMARLFDGPGQRHADRPARRPRISASRSGRIPAPTPGRASSGRSAAAPRGAGTRTIPSST